MYLPTYRRSPITYQILSVVNFKYSAVLCRSAAEPIEYKISSAMSFRELRYKLGKLTENYEEKNGYYVTVTLTFDPRCLACVPVLALAEVSTAAKLRSMAWVQNRQLRN